MNGFESLGNGRVRVSGKDDCAMIPSLDRNRSVTHGRACAEIRRMRAVGQAKTVGSDTGIGGTR